MGGKFIYRVFKTDKDGKLMEQKWENWKATFKPFSDKIDKDFFSTYKKVFDVEITTAKPIPITTYKGLQEDDTFVLQATSSGKVQSMILATILDEAPTKEDGKKEYDWEDGIINSLEGQFVKFGITWTWLETRYNFKAGKAFSTAWIESLPGDENFF